jgi:subtilisin family serine protease
LLGTLLLTGCGGGGGGSSVVNYYPIARDDGFTLDVVEDLKGFVGLNDTLSKDGGNVWRLTSNPINGTIVFESSGHFTYTPNDSNVVSDSFTYVLADVNGDSSSAKVYISVLPILYLNDTFIESQWHLKSISALDSDAVPNDLSQKYAQGFTGNGVEVAVIDDGLDIKHEDLIDNVVLNGSYNFIDQTNDPTPTDDNKFHGTAVAGLVGARGGNEKGIWGVAPSGALKGFNFIASSQDIQIELASHGYEPSAKNFNGLSVAGVDVFNKSYGRNPTVVPSGTDLTLAQEVISIMAWGTEYLRDDKGAVYVKAGGNEFKNGSVSCANGMTCFNVNMETEHVTPYQMVVGAFNENDKRASYSNTGSALWLSAPGGESIGLTTTDQSTCTSGDNKQNTSEDPNCNYISTFAGTSAAAPIVSGAAALLLEANPELTWRDVKHILATTARQLDSDLAAKTMNVAGTNVTLESGWVENGARIKYSNAYGFGAVNVDAAITKALNNYAPLPAMQTVSTGKMTLSSGNEIADFNAIGLSQTKAISQAYTTESVVLTLSIVGQDSNTEGDTAHNIDISDYQILLTSPSGKQSILLTPFNSYLPHYDMNDLSLISHAFYDEAMNGNWTVTVRDLDNTTNGTGLGKLVDWSLKLYGRQP